MKNGKNENNGNNEKKKKNGKKHWKNKNKKCKKVRKKKGTKKNQTLNPEGRTPPFRRLTCLLLGLVLVLLFSFVSSSSSPASSLRDSVRLHRYACETSVWSKTNMTCWPLPCLSFCLGRRGGGGEEVCVHVCVWGRGGMQASQRRPRQTCRQIGPKASRRRNTKKRNMSPR